MKQKQFQCQIDNFCCVFCQISNEDFEIHWNLSMDVLKRFKGQPPDGQDSPKESGTKSRLLSTWYNMKYGKAMFSLESNNTITMQSPVWLLGQCYHRKMRQRIHVADQVNKSDILKAIIDWVDLSNFVQFSTFWIPFNSVELFHFVPFLILIHVQFLVLSNFSISNFLIFVWFSILSNFHLCPTFLFCQIFNFS